MLKNPPRKSIANFRRKSTYRPVRRAKIEQRDTWQCVNINYPLGNVVKGCTIFDFFRATCDTIVMIVLLVYMLDLKYEDIMLIKPKEDKNGNGIDEMDDDAPTTFRSLTKDEYSRLFSRTKETLCVIIGITSVIVVSEIPLSIFLLKAVKNQEKSQMVIWAQTSLVIIFFNFIAFTLVIVYTSKAGLILDNDTWVSNEGTNLSFLTYMTLLRTAIFDLTKGAEIIFVNAFSKEIERQRTITFGEEPELPEPEDQV